MGKNQYSKIKDEMKKIYFSIGFLHSQAFNNEKIYFDDSGFRHMLFKGKDPRPIADQVRRFKLFKHVSSIVKETKEISTFITIRKAKFWSLEQTINEKRVVIVIRQILTGNKHFFSIMPKKHKGPKRDL